MPSATLFGEHIEPLCQPKSRIDLSRAGVDDFEGLYRACKPAECRQDGEDVLDESYRKSGRMEPDSFSTLLDPYGLGIHEQVSKTLFTELFVTIDMELSELNVYGKGDFCKPRMASDAPRSQEMFGSLVILLPTPHEGGHCTCLEPLVHFVAFHQGVKHKILPVTLGYRVTLTSNLYHQRRVHPGIPKPFDCPVARLLANLVNDKSTLPNGGYLGFGLACKYAAHTRWHNMLNLLPADQLNGSDHALVDACEALSLRWSLRLLYYDVGGSTFDLLTTSPLVIDESVMEGVCDRTSKDHLKAAVVGLADDQAEGVVIQVIGEIEYELDWEQLEDEYEWLGRFYGEERGKEMLKVTAMNSQTRTETQFLAWDEDRLTSEIQSLCGYACMVVVVEPAVSRSVVGL